MSMSAVKFSYNWNGKLFCQCLSTIRLRNDAKYYVGAEVELQFKSRSLGTGIIRSITHFKLHKLNESMARLDTGYDEHTARQMIHTMYKNVVFDWGAQYLSFIIIDRPGYSAPPLPAATNEKTTLSNEQQ